MYCVLPYVFQTSMDVLPIYASCLHALLEDFLWPFNSSKAAPALDSFLNHFRQLRNSAVKLSPSTICIVKKLFALTKGLGFKYDPSEVMFLLEVISVCFLCAHP